MTDFLWGVATASYQVEGGINGPGQPLNNWAAWDAAGRIERCGDALRFWDEPGELLGRAADLGCNAFRMSIEWARVQPSTNIGTRTEPPWDDAALDRYAHIIASARRVGMEPVVTLFHFTHPAWLGEQFWLDPSSPQRFALYADRCVTELNRRLVQDEQQPLRWIITLNEPAVVPITSYVLGMWPPGVRDPRKARVVHEHIVAAHVLGYDAVHDAYERAGWPAPLVSTNTIAWSMVAFDAVVTDALLARERGVAQHQLEAFLTDRARAARVRLAQIRRSNVVASALDAVIDRVARRAGLRPDGPALQALYASPRARKLDYLSFDYYDPIIGHFASLGSAQARRHRKIPIAAELWEQLSIPDGLVVFLRQAAEQAPDRPILLAENGMSTPGFEQRPDGLRRDVFLEDMCGAVRRARDEEKINVVGYLHWTLADNYEWGSYKPAFGLHAVDRTNGVRILDTDAVGIDAAGAFRRIIAEDLKRG